MYKLTHVIRYTVHSKFVIFDVLDGVITGCSFLQRGRIACNADRCNTYSKSVLLMTESPKFLYLIGNRGRKTRE